MQSVEVELLTDELRQLVGRGARPLRLVSLPTLRGLARVDGNAQLTARQRGNLIRSFIAETIQAMSDTYEFQGEPLDADKLRRVLRLLLKFEGTSQDALNRRERVLHILELPYPLLQMRRPDSPERELLRLLAVEMVSSRQITA